MRVVCGSLSELLMDHNRGTYGIMEHKCVLHGLYIFLQSLQLGANILLTRAYQFQTIATSTWPNVVSIYSQILHLE